MKNNKLPPDIKKIQKTLNFPEDQIIVAVRALFCCEYCGKNLLQSVDSYDSWQIDHIVPDGSRDPENLALSCKTCNFAKRHTTISELSNYSSRNEKIEQARQIVWERRTKKEINLMKVREFARLLLKLDYKST